MGAEDFRSRFTKEKHDLYFGNEYDPTFITWDIAQDQIATRNFMRVAVYVSDPSLPIISQKASMSLTSLTSGLGGSAGLLLGISVVTGIEILAFIADMIRYTVLRLKAMLKTPG